MTANVADELFTDSEEYYQRLLLDMNSARGAIDFEVYLFDSDEIGHQVVQGLIAAARRNVKVRLLVDGVGSPYWGGELAQQLDEAGVENRVYNPVPFYIWQWSRSNINRPLVSKLVHFVLSANRRNHRKMCLVDNKIAWVGSFNISSHHLPKNRGGEGWHDLGVRLTSYDMHGLAEAFEQAWCGTRFFLNRQKLPVDGAIRLNNSTGRRYKFYQDLLRRLEQSQNRIWIINAYFVPIPSLLRRLRKAAKQGRDVRILLPSKSDVFFMPSVSATFYKPLLKAGVRIFEFLPSVLHSKAILIDDWMTVGSSNLDHRSLLHDLEVDVVLNSKESKRKLEQQFLADVEQSREVLLEELPHYSLWKKVLSRIFGYLKYWL